MNYSKLKVLFLAAQDAYKDGKLTDAQFENILMDIENEVIVVDKKIMNEDINLIIHQYSNS